METLFNRLASLADGGGFDTILHIGAGTGVELQGYRALGVRRLVLVEGDPEAAEALRAHPALRAAAEVIERPVAPATGPADWHRYNLPTLNGMLPPGSLSALYPRLKVLSRDRVQALALRELLEGVALDAGARNMLFLDVPGQEEALVATVPEQLLEAFAWIVVRGCRSACYEGGAAIDAARRALQARCFSVELADADTDPDWPVLLLRRDDVQRENRRLQARVAELMAGLAAAKDAVSAAGAELTQVSRERDEQAKLAANRKTELDHANALTQQQAERIRQLEAERSQSERRQNWLSQEMIKAEAQIELIKDVLLREPGL
jgi:hypothetical protein